MDVRVFNPLAPSTCSSLFLRNMRTSNVVCSASVQFVKVSVLLFLIVLSATKGLAYETTIFYKHLASLLCIKWRMSSQSQVGFVANWTLLCSACSFIGNSNMCNTQKCTKTFSSKDAFQLKFLEIIYKSFEPSYVMLCNWIYIQL